MTPEVVAAVQQYHDALKSARAARARRDSAKESYDNANDGLARAEQWVRDCQGLLHTAISESGE